MENSWKLTQVLLLVASFFSFQSASLFAQSTLFLFAPNWKQPSLTHTVFHGSNRHYDSAPFTAGENKISDDLLSTVGAREHGQVTWKYKIVGMDVCDWKFVSVYEVPSGPWTLYGGNDTVAHLRWQTRIATARK